MPEAIALDTKSDPSSRECGGARLHMKVRAFPGLPRPADALVTLISFLNNSLPLILTPHLQRTQRIKDAGQTTFCSSDFWLFQVYTLPALVLYTY